MRYIIMLIVLLLPMSAYAKNYVVYYADDAPVSAFEPYDLLVLDSKYHPPLAALKEQGKVLLGYISLGEVEKQRDYYQYVLKDDILLMENQHWQGSFFVDMRDDKWTNRVLDELIPDILEQGFDGLFLDTLDNPSELERTDLVEYSCMRKAAISLVKAIRKKFPDIKIMMNRGYEILPYVAMDIDMEMGESVYADYDFDNKVNGLVDKKLYIEQVKILNDAKQINPQLEIYTLDYWDIEDKEGIADIYKHQRKNGFIPYVSRLDLNVIVPEPK